LKCKNKPTVNTIIKSWFWMILYFFVFFYGLKTFLKKYFFSLNNFLYIFLDWFDMLMSKIILKNKKIYYFKIFLKELHFKKQLVSHS